jgi:hypothetical protein
MTDGRPRCSRLAKWVTAITATVVAGVLFLVGYVLGRVAAVPLSTDFWKVAAQPLATFGAGVFALFAGVSALIGAHLISSRSQTDTTRVLDQHEDAAVRDVDQREAAAARDVEQRERAAGSTELWRRFEWVADRVSEVNGVESLIDEEQAAKMIVSIRDAARDLGDHHLYKC